MNLSLQVVLGPIGVLICLDALVAPPGLGVWVSSRMPAQRIHPVPAVSAETLKPSSFRCGKHDHSAARGLSLCELLSDPSSDSAEVHTPTDCSTPAWAPRPCILRPSGGLGPSPKHQEEIVDELRLRPAMSTFSFWLTYVRRGMTPFARFTMRFLSGQLEFIRGRHRDILPLPLATEKDLRRRPNLVGCWRAIMLDLVNMSGAALNWMYCGGHGCRVPHASTALHRQVFQTILDKYLCLGQLLDESDTRSPTAGALERLLCLGSPGVYPDLDASRVDVIDNAGAVDPLESIDPELASCIRSPAFLFFTGDSGFTSSARVADKDRVEYCRLLSRQLRPGKLDAARTIKATAPIFTIGKKNGTSQREI